MATGHGEDIYNLLVQEIEDKPKEKEQQHVNKASVYHDLLMYHDDTQYTPVTPHVFLKPSKIKPYIGRRKWLTPGTTIISQQTPSINLLTGQLRNPLADLPKHFVNKSIDESIVDQGYIEQIPIHNHHRYITQRMSKQDKNIPKSPLIPALIESFMDVLEDLATTHYYESNYYSNTGFYYNMMYDTTQSIKRFYNNASALYKHMFVNVEEQKPRVSKKKFLRRVMKWFAEHQNELQHEKDANNKESNEVTSYDATECIGLTLMIHKLHRMSKQDRKKTKLSVVADLRIPNTLPNAFTLEQVTTYLEEIHHRSDTMESVMSQVPTELSYMYMIRKAQKRMIEKLIKELITKSKRGEEHIDEPILAHIQSLRPTLDQKCFLLWYMHVIAHCKNVVQRKWMKKVLVAYKYHSIVANVIHYLRTQVSDKNRYLNLVDRKVFISAWVDKCDVNSELAEKVISKLIR